MAKAYAHPIYGDIVSAEKNISSGLLAEEFLAAKVKEGKVAYIGKESSAFFIKAAGLQPLPILTITENFGVNALALLDKGKVLIESSGIIPIYICESVIT